jgi:hypothetical protein
MSDEQTFDQRLTAAIQKQIAAFENDPIAKGQAALDRWWQMQLDLRAALKVRPHDYNPIKRFQEEMDDEIERRDQAYRRR